jgi:hypothetical protein
MAATETVVSARLAFKDDDEDERTDRAWDDDLPTRREARSQEQPQQDDQGSRATVADDLPAAEALLSLEAPVKQERDIEQPSPATRLLSSGTPEDAPTSAPYDLDTRHDDLLGESKPWSFDDPDGAEEAFGYRGRNPYAASQQATASAQPSQPMQPLQSQPAYTDNYQPASYSFWADPYSARPNPYVQPTEPVQHNTQFTPGKYTPGNQPFQPTAAPTSPDQIFGQPAAGSGVPMYTPIFSPETMPDLQPVAYPTRRGTLTPVTLPVSTGPIWAMALLPIFMLVFGLLFLLSGGAGRLSPMFAAVIVVGPYLIAIGLAIADRKALQRHGYEHTANWAWALLGAPVYLIVRLASVVRETGRGFGPLLTWIATALTAVVAIVAVPGILLALAPSTFSAEAESAIVSDAAVLGTLLTVDCPDVPPLLIQQSMTCEAISDDKIFPITVSLQRSNGWIDWRVDDWGMYATNR